MLWFGLILIIIALVLVFFSKRSETKVHYVKATETTKVGAVQQLVNEVAADMPDGMALGYKDYVELKGRVVCDEPIRGELSDQVGAIVETEVIRVYERREETRDSQGHVRTEWRRTEETVSSNRRESPFWLDDGTGRIRVKANRGVELVKTFERFEQPQGGYNESGFGGQVSVGSGRFQISVGGGHWDMNSQRTLGFKFIERLLPVNKPVYAIGEVAVIEDEGLVFRPPTEDDKKKPFMLSPRTEEEIVKSAEKSATVLKVIAVVVGLGGAALVVFGALR